MRFCASASDEVRVPSPAMAAPKASPSWAKSASVVGDHFQEVSMARSEAVKTSLYRCPPKNGSGRSSADPRKTPVAAGQP